MGGVGDKRESFWSKIARQIADTKVRLCLWNHIVHPFNESSSEPTSVHHSFCYAICDRLVRVPVLAHPPGLWSLLVGHTALCP